jgi:hypothetical protein
MPPNEKAGCGDRIRLSMFNARDVAYFRLSIGT